MFDFLLLYISSTQDGRTPAEVAQSRGHRDIAKLIIDEGMYLIICENNFKKIARKQFAVSLFLYVVFSIG